MFRGGIIKRSDIILPFRVTEPVSYTHLDVYKRQPYAQLPAMPAYMPVEPFEAFPK